MKPKFGRNRNRSKTNAPRSGTKPRGTKQPVFSSAGLVYEQREDGTYLITGHTEELAPCVKIPATYRGKAVTAIGRYAFFGCTGLTEIAIPAGVASIGDNAFEDCTGLTAVAIPAGVTSIGLYVLRGCTRLAGITVEQGNGRYRSEGNCLIETESQTLIAGCQNSVIPDDDSVTRIDAGAFGYCTGLTDMTIPASVKSIGYCAFTGCTSLARVTFADESRLEHIGVNAFTGCTGLTEIAIPASVTSIGEYAFCKCARRLASITVEQGNSRYRSEGNCLIETESRVLIAGCKNSVIPDDGSVTSIGDDAFYGCMDLTDMTIPTSVTSIGAEAFEDCTGLTDMTIPASVTRIGEKAFDGCTSLARVTFAETVGWSSAGGSPIDVRDPAANAKNLTEQCCGYDWKRSCAK